MTQRRPPPRGNCFCGTSTEISSLNLAHLSQTTRQHHQDCTVESQTFCTVCTAQTCLCCQTETTTTVTSGSEFALTPRNHQCVSSQPLDKHLETTTSFDRMIVCSRDLEQHRRRYALSGHATSTRGVACALQAKSGPNVAVAKASVAPSMEEKWPGRQLPQAAESQR